MVLLQARFHFILLGSRMDSGINNPSLSIHKLFCSGSFCAGGLEYILISNTHRWWTQEERLSFGLADFTLP